MNSERIDPPRDIEALRAMISARQARFPKRLAQTARHVLDNPDEVALGSVASIAEAAGITPSTLVRFAQALGYDGFSALQTVFRDAVRAKIAPGEITRRNSEAGIARDAQAFFDTIEACHLSLEALSKAVSIADVSAAANLLSRANCVYIIARDATFPLGALVRHALMGLKIRLILLSDLIGGEDLLAFATKQDVAIIISCAPYNEETTAQASSLVKLGVPVITLTDSNYSPLSSLATVRFNVLESSRGGVVRSTAGIALSEALAVCARETREAEGLISS
jgi:DNA-binding MurR/RpiR family transcriptional regulator